MWMYFTVAIVINVTLFYRIGRQEGDLVVCMVAGILAAYVWARFGGLKWWSFLLVDGVAFLLIAGIRIAREKMSN